MALFFSVPNRSGRSPPSPELDLPPRRFMATARHSCASCEIEPYDIAPVLKRLTISSSLSTSSSGMPSVCLKDSSPRRVCGAFSSSMIAAYSRKRS